MKIDKQSRGEFIMSKKVQLKDMELNQVAGGVVEEFIQKLKDIFTPQPIIPITHYDPVTFPGDPIRPIYQPVFD